jgi:uncharacterized protein
MATPDSQMRWGSFQAKIERLVDKGRLAKARYLLGRHPLLRFTDTPSEILLTYAIRTGDHLLTNACLDLGARLDGDNTGFPPIYYALERADDDLSMLDLLSQRGADPNVRMINDHTALHLAARYDKPRAAELLLTKGADVNAATRIDSYHTPLMEASYFGYVELVRLLLRFGANPDFTNCMGETYETVAPKRSRSKIVETVKEWKAQSQRR